MNDGPERIVLASSGLNPRSKAWIRLPGPLRSNHRRAVGRVGPARGGGLALSKVGPPLAASIELGRVPMRSYESQNGPEIERLGQIDISGNHAVVTWPQLGDGVALDFPDLRARYGVVVDLDHDPRLKVEPHFANLVDLEGRLGILEQVSALWIQRNLQCALSLDPEALR